MRSIISALLIVLFAASMAFSQSYVMRRPIIVGGGGCDSCTGTLILSSHFENNDDITQGTPCGCSTNADITWAKTGATYTSVRYTDGGYSIFRNGTGQQAVITQDASKTAGTLIFSIYVTAEYAYSSIVTFYIDSNNWIDVSVADDYDNIMVEYKGGGTGTHATDIAHLTTGTWHTITAKWRTASSPYLSIQVDGNSPVVSTTPLNTITGTPSSLYIGYTSSAAIFYIDQLSVYNAWL